MSYVGARGGVISKMCTVFCVGARGCHMHVFMFTYIGSLDLPSNLSMCISTVRAIRQLGVKCGGFFVLG